MWDNHEGGSGSRDASRAVAGATGIVAKRGSSFRDEHQRLTRRTLIYVKAVNLLQQHFLVFTHHLNIRSFSSF